MSVTESETTLRNRFDHKADDGSDPRPTDDVLVEKLDRFLSSIESRLSTFEEFFKWRNEELAQQEQSVEDDYTLSLRASSRRSSNASLSSIRMFTGPKLNLIHQRLKLIKASVLKSGFTNLDYLYKTLDDQYNYLFSTGPFTNTTTELTNKEILSQKIITTMQYFDDKLLQIDDYMQKSCPNGKIDFGEDSTLSQFRFYNFNKALKHSQDGYLHYYELPLSWRENRYIINGYRFSIYHAEMFKSIFHFNHNETMNIWTHIIGFIALCYISLYHFPLTDVFSMNTWKDNVVMYAFLVASMSCLLSSIVWHTYSGFAKLPVRSSCACVDYTGITILITLSIITAEYCSLYNHKILLCTYMIFSSVSGIAGFGFNWSPYFDKPECRSVRIAFFVGLALLGVTTFFCVCFYDGFVKAIKFFLPMTYKSFIWYWIGVIFYGGLIPERWRYDVIIKEDEACEHSHDASDIINGIENSGEEEMKEFEEELDNIEDEKVDDVEKMSHYKKIIDIHFPAEPTLTPYSKDFLSLWWVDYLFSSHNFWHIFVVFGIIGHYFSVLDMFAAIERSI
ncbi:uncharacterized protein PRCAT00002103001 [Priceomyces carsonii]|uniref:uncharacterized protein n=1 Tax=Priceomyces carsonii TaxID=28549 RepID=UPI002ED93DD9|nr:unnamed protein product [Priceomyces carsonii]